MIGAVVIAVGIIVGVAAPAQAQPTARGLTKVSQLRNAPIPASCEHKATRLHGYERNFGTYKGFAALDTKNVVFVAPKGSSRKEAVVPLGCSAGGVTWPELLLVYAPGPRLVGSINLGRIPTVQEHEDVAGLKVHKGVVHVAWRGYDGAGFAISTYRGAVTVHRHRLGFSHTGPLTIDYTPGQRRSESYGGGPGIYNGPGDGVFF
ncbi:MAG: hypothetical protein INR67_20800, partial [Jatrophihabitans endophyticus]